MRWLRDIERSTVARVGREREYLPQNDDVLFLHADERSQLSVFRFQELPPGFGKHDEPLPKPVRHQGGPVQMEQDDVEASGFRQRIEGTRAIIAAHVKGQVIPERMEHAPPSRCVCGSREEVPLVQVAATATVDEIVIAVCAANRTRLMVVNGQLPAHVVLGHAAVSTAPGVALAHLFVPGMGHRR